ncbi:FAD-dependent oxidoreductase [Agrococcus sp. ARC_14]|uniref:FAD-dependent oxidoreductase n=1 Tax=Agrococcus sp. ARC_14 TaxID=2919927 RepID=UPI001F057190|nr:FAD-dependent oxidoreductase [Agrococcus sp. ARC_14]MCH1881400.1 FAD-dependent oxidoreductase [Agrococcus sp. ARC_14]
MPAETADDSFAVDVIVIGAGIGGLTIASELARRGYEVGVVEIGDHVGGSAVLSEGYVWTALDEDAFLNEDPDGDASKFLAMRAELFEALAELEGRGIEVGPVLENVLGFGTGRQLDIGRYIDHCTRVVESAGGWVLLEHEVESLVTRSGAVTGVVVRDPEGATEPIAARAVVIATGGFQGSPQLRSEFIGPWASDLLLRANPASIGGGVELGRSVGAALSLGGDGFYGHLVPYPLDRWDPSNYTALSQYHSDEGVLLSREGQRFADEAHGDHVNAQEVAKVGRALLFIDDELWQRRGAAVFIPGMPALDKVRDAVEIGAHVSVADNLAELVAPVASWGFDADATLASLTEVQRTATGPRGSALRQPPFALMEVQSAITFTLGGLSTGVHGQVLNEAGGTVPGLWAAGVDAGGLNVRGYTGGLVRGLVLGRITARAIDAALQRDER